MDKLLNRYFTGTLPGNEKAILFRQLEHDDALKAEFVRLQSIVAISGMASRAEDESWTAESFRKVMRSVKIRRYRRISLSVLKYAAVVLLLAGTWFLSKEFTAKETASDGYTLIEAPKGQRVYVTLADGTEVWLSSRTQLKVPSQFNKQGRTVELNGEGLFSASKNGQKPFIVQTRQYNVQVTGTQFNVFAYSESPMFETDLIEGSVFVFRKGQENNRLCLSPNEKASVQSGKLQKSPSAFLRLQYIRNGIYCFENQTLQELAKRLELWYDVKITITKPEIANYRFSGKFRQTDDISHILQAVKETGRFNYRILDEKRIEIKPSVKHLN